ncbi:ORF4' protein [Southwest baboon virus 1]|uniref:ORF4' protein n=1 Tax=Southwest baboon virus 1 TaxID=1546178 RepID=UPI0004F6D58C|nr:ORF4' protein [Southwest baboon virus 1]AIP91328.1 ORF4' protein [Southwest baboon virus 1]AIP91342.1 ORF4' protein [Southwest baboon virus 1]AIP91356.1 ORF4' protein [Southwest baboon virus 1]
MGSILCGIAAALFAFLAYAGAQSYLIPCYGHNTTQLREVDHLLNATDITLYDDACWAGIQVGVVKSVVETIEAKTPGIDDAFTAIAFASCLARAIHFESRGIHTRLVVNKTQVYLQVNITTQTYQESFPTPWFIHPGALRWATVLCGLLAIFRAVNG